MDRPIAAPPGRRRRWRRPLWLGVLSLVLAAVLALVGSYAWIGLSARGHLFDPATAPTTDVVIVFGAKVAPGGTRPMPFLAGRLRTAADLVRDGRAKVILVSGDAAGASGNETAVMTDYLVHDLGVPAGRVVADPGGLDSYDTCARARRVYGVTRALLVTQEYHLGRAVTLCRGQGIDADGVAAACDNCPSDTLRRNALRDVVAGPKAAWDAFWNRDPAVGSPPDPALSEALART